MNCPFCHQEINNPDPIKHLRDCQQQEAKKWDAAFRVKLAEMIAQRQEAQ